MTRLQIGEMPAGLEGDFAVVVAATRSDSGSGTSASPTFTLSILSKAHDSHARREQQLQLIRKRRALSACARIASPYIAKMMACHSDASFCYLGTARMTGGACPTARQFLGAVPA
jgi:hypothetical protein